MTLSEFIAKIEIDETLKAKVESEIMEKVILPMYEEISGEKALDDSKLEEVSGGYRTPFGMRS